MNVVTIVGNLGKDPELRHTANDKSVANFSVATTEGFGDSKHTEWHTVVAWGKQADNVNKYLSKGSKVAVSGRLQYRSFEGKDGNRRYVTEIVANNVIIGLSKITLNIIGRG